MESAWRMWRGYKEGREGRGVQWAEGGGRGLRLGGRVVSILQGGMEGPDVSGTSGENGETLGSVVCVHGKSELGVICVLMILDAMAGDDHPPDCSTRQTTTGRVQTPVERQRRAQPCLTDAVPS